MFAESARQLGNVAPWPGLYNGKLSGILALFGLGLIPMMLRKSTHALRYSTGNLLFVMAGVFVMAWLSDGPRGPYVALGVALAAVFGLSLLHPKVLDQALPKIDARYGTVPDFLNVLSSVLMAFAFIGGGFILFFTAEAPVWSAVALACLVEAILLFMRNVVGLLIGGVAGIVALLAYSIDGTGFWWADSPIVRPDSLWAGDAIFPFAIVFLGSLLAWTLVTDGLGHLRAKQWRAG